MYIKHIDEQGNPSIKYFSYERDINIKKSSDNNEQFQIIMSTSNNNTNSKEIQNCILANNIDLKESKKIVDKIFDLLCQGESFCDITKDVDR